MFFTDEDDYCYLHWLGAVAGDCGCTIHAYGLMANHVHLLLAPLASRAHSRMMQSVGRRYVQQYINRFYRRTGSLGEGRYKSSVVQDESYLLACQRYSELNPVRVGMVVDPGQCRWSSYRANGLGAEDARLTLHSLSRSLGVDAGERQVAYRMLFRPESDAEAADDIRQALQLSMPAGNERFAQTISARQGIRYNTGQRGRPNKPVGDIRTPSVANQQDWGFLGERG